jgi:hypothetical protein
MKKIILFQLLGLICLGQGKPSLYFTIKSKDCLNCYINTKNIFSKLTKSNDYVILFDNISEENVFGFINNNLNISPSIKKIQTNDSLFQLLNKNISSSVVIYHQEKILYSKQIKEINQFELEKIQRILSTIQFSSSISNSSNQTNVNYRKYMGNQFIKPIVIGSSIYLYNDLEHVVYKETNNSIKNFINLKELLNDSLVKSYIRASKFLKNPDSILKYFYETKEQMNRTFKVNTIFRLSNFLFVDIGIYALDYKDYKKRPGIFYPDFSLKFDTLGNFISYYEFPWSIDKEENQFIYFDNNLPKGQNELYIKMIDYKDNSEKIVSINFDSKTYYTPTIHSEIIYPKELLRKNKRGIPIGYYLGFSNIDNKKCQYFISSYPEICDILTNQKTPLSGIVDTSTHFEQGIINFDLCYYTEMNQQKHIFYNRYIINPGFYVNIYNKENQLIHTKKISDHNQDVLSYEHHHLRTYELDEQNLFFRDFVYPDK